MMYVRWTLITLVTAASLGCAGKLDPNLNYLGSSAISSPGSDAGAEPEKDAGGAPTMRDASTPATNRDPEPEPNPPEADEDAGGYDDDAGPVGGNGSTEPDEGKRDAGPAEPPPAVACDFRALMNEKCGNLNCHGAPAQLTGLDLTSPGLANRTKDRSGMSACPDHLLIDKADPEKSMLYLKVIGDECGTQMPLGGSLTADEQACVLEWIEGL